MSQGTFLDISFPAFFPNHQKPFTAYTRILRIQSQNSITFDKIEFRLSLR